jgi:hypothetical protein
MEAYAAPELAVCERDVTGKLDDDVRTVDRALGAERDRYGHVVSLERALGAEVRGYVEARIASS